MLRLPVLAVTVLLVLGLLGTPAQGTTAATDVAAPAPITWSACTDDELRFLDLQCGRLRVPLDHADPAGPTIELALTIRRHTVAASGYRGVMLVNPDKHPTVKVKEGQAFIDWLVSPEGQAAIADYKIGGEQLFFPSAKKG